MRLFYVRALSSKHPDRMRRTWLIVAKDESEARALAPDGDKSVPTIEFVRDLPRSGSRQSGVIGWLGDRMASIN